MLLKIFAVVGVLTWTSAAFAEPVGGFDVGYARVVSGEDINGFGVTLYGGWDVGGGLVPELKAGMRYFGEDRTIFGIETERTLWIFPVEAGVRYTLPLDIPVRPFVGLHLGMAVTRVSAEVTGVADDTDNDVGFALDGGAGVHWVLNSDLALGAAFWYEAIFTENFLTENVQDLLVVFDLRYAF